jgi:hypothetical protein
VTLEHLLKKSATAADFSDALAVASDLGFDFGREIAVADRDEN